MPKIEKTDHFADAGKKAGCYGCVHAGWDSEGCTCNLDGLHVWNPSTGCKYRKNDSNSENFGMWILCGGDATNEFRCSKCRKLIKIPGPLYYSECPYKYCPNCGKRNLNPHEKPDSVKGECE